MGEQSEVIEVTETSSQDRNLQRTVKHALVDFVEVDKTIPQEPISERMGEQIGVVEVSKISGQESAEIVKIISQKQMSERTREQIGVIEAPETASKDRRLQRTAEHAFVDRVETVKIALQLRILQRVCEPLGVIEVPKGSEREQVCRVHGL